MVTVSHPKSNLSKTLSDSHRSSHLALGKSWDGHSPSQCTLRGILHLVRGCPNLTSLAIVFQASAEIPWNGRPGGGVVSQHMHELAVGQSPISNPRAVASFLSDIF